MRKIIVFIGLAILFTGISYLFWSEDLKYSLPTRVPKNCKSIMPGSLVDLNNKIVLKDKKPLFIHFFNPSCPCSRFNIPHFKSLVRLYNDQLDFAIVVMSPDKSITKMDIQNKFDLDLPVYFDKSIADSLGVYSTPQAVIVDKNHKLYYRGNYNKSRYCENKNTNYAQMAIDSLLHNSSNHITFKEALKSYGCSLPNCVNTGSDGTK
jgi:hypothetical protein